MKVTVFAPYYETQPYVRLYKEALEQQGLIVYLEPEFNLKWLLTKGRYRDAIHLHWIEEVYKPVKSKNRSGLTKKLIDNRLMSPLWGTLRLAHLSAALSLAKLQGKIIVYTVHNLDPHSTESRLFVILRRIAHWVVSSLAHKVHVHNQYSRDILETVYKRKNGIEVIPIGNYVGYYPNTISQLEARRQLGLPEKAFVYLFLGWIRPYKGVEDLITAFKMLDLAEGRLLIVGGIAKSIHKTILSLVQDKPTIKLIHEFVPDEDLQIYMKACNICVLPYKHITTSSASILALSFGRPVIVPAITSFPELITPETGILYDPSQPNNLVSALQQASQSTWSEPRIFDYIEQFDWNKLGPQLASLYQSEFDTQQEITSEEG